LPSQPITQMGSGVRFDTSQASCLSHNLDLWFPEAVRNTTTPKHKEETAKAVEALRICATCPIRQGCLDNSFSSVDTINYGIYGGTLPYERREAIGKKSREMNNNTTYYQHTYRKLADKHGVPRHYIKPREVSGDLWHGIYQGEQSA